MSAVTVHTGNAGLMPRVMKALGEPFASGCVGWKPGATNGEKTKAIALAYIDARDVMDRLDSLVAAELIEAWRDEYEPLQAGAVRCRLYLCVAGQWIAKEDVGGASAQPDAGDKMKAAFSDALKRAAVKWGIGRYLYHLEAAWCDYDARRKQFARTPTLPAWALPGGSSRPPSYSLPPHLAAEAHDDPEPPKVQPARQDAPPPAKPAPDAVPRLLQGYATAKTIDDLAALERRRKELWGGLTAEAKATLKAASGETAARLNPTAAGGK